MRKFKPRKVEHIGKKNIGAVLSGGEVLENQFPLLDGKRLYHPNPVKPTPKEYNGKSK